jgi:putative tryptophan/tyrosine transport system substrate-binding protein
VRRRKVITLVSGAAVAHTGFSLAQTRMPVIGFLSSRSPGESADVVAAFRSGLREAGFVEGQNIIIAFRWAEGRYERLPALAAELVQLRVAVLLSAGGSPAAQAAKASTATIPIVFSAVADPVELGLVASLNRPGGNMTGMSNFNTVLGAKRVELMRELVPAGDTFAYLVNPSNPGWQAESEGAQSAADAFHVKLHLLRASSEPELDKAFEAAIGMGAHVLAASGEAFFDSHRDMLIALAARKSLPAIFGWREYVISGGLMSYGSSLPDSYRQAGIYCARILKGEKPADLPVMQPTKFSMAVNLKTARSLGLTIPPSLLARADEVIE